jgi:hypothetical protein
VSRGFKSSSSVTITVLFNARRSQYWRDGLVARRLRMEDGRSSRSRRCNTCGAVVLYPHMVITVPSGHVGVLWKRFGGGTVLDPRLLKNEGFNLILPWNEVFQYDLRLQSFTESYNAISSDGVNLTASVVVRFRLQRDAVPVLHQAIGPNYQKVLV